MNKKTYFTPEMHTVEFAQELPIPTLPYPSSISKAMRKTM